MAKAIVDEAIGGFSAPARKAFDITGVDNLCRLEILEMNTAFSPPIFCHAPGDAADTTSFP
jgi:hypothetical protein